MNTKQRKEWESIMFGQENPDFNYEDFLIIQKIKRLATKHQRQCENSCNGYGAIKGQAYFSGAIDDYAKRQHGYSVKSACIGDDDNIFDIEAGRIEAKIRALAKSTYWNVEFQGDPRGATVKLFYLGKFINLG